MPKIIGLSLCAAFILWHFIRDQKLRPMTSWGLWVTLPWIMLVGSRSLFSWSGGQIDDLSTDTDTLLEGSPLDRNTLILLIVLGALTLWRRKPDWHKIMDSNRWFFVFFIYCGISIIWSDFPFVSFKRWIKELGNIIMVLIILTETNPVQATRAVFARYTYFAIPLSVALIILFPDIGSYMGSDMETLYGGVATNKNTLGIITFICGLFLIWDMFHVRSADGRKSDMPDILSRVLLLMMVAWLIYLAHSLTSLVCLILGTGILLFMKFPSFRRQFRFFGVYSLVAGYVVFILYYSGILQVLVKISGRDMTLTGRTDLWADILRESINPLVGTGYQSFWLGTRADFLWEKYYFHPTQAHNGYLEIYLNGGWIGVLLLMAMIVATGSKLKKSLLLERSFGILLVAFLVTAVCYNWTEARFSNLNLLWVLLSLAALYNPLLYVDQQLKKPVPGHQVFEKT